MTTRFLELTTLRRTLLTTSKGLENAKNLVTQYKQGKIQSMTPELWQAKKIVDSTLHPGKCYGRFPYHKPKRH